MLGMPNVFLDGGPEIPAQDRIHYAEDTEAKIVMPRGHCYDHFVPTVRTTVQAGRELTVFSWSGRTYVAE